MSTYREFYTSVLGELGLPTGQNNLDALACIAIIEGANDRYNPLNSVVPSGDSTQFNSVGVQDYKSYANGVAGTVALLRGDPWAGVRTELSTDNYEAVLHAFATEYATWGSHPNFDGVGQATAHALLDQSLGSDGPASVPAPPAPAQGQHGGTYIVAPGDTLSGIAQTHGLNDWHTLYDANRTAIGDNPNLIQVGTVLTIPGSATKPVPAPNEGPLHYVVAGETLSGIAEHYHIADWHTLYNYGHNRSVIGSNPDDIYPGQRLQIP